MLIPTRENAAVLFLDLQEEIVKNSRTLPLARLTRSAGALAKLAALHGLPHFLSAVPPGGAFLEEVLAPLGHPAPSMRFQTTAFSDASLVAGLAAAVRPVLILAGVASEIVVQRTALDAIAAGYSVMVAVDACGGVDARTEDATWRRIVAAGGTTTSVTTFAAELVGEFTTELGGATLGIVYETLGGLSGERVLGRTGDHRGHDHPSLADPGLGVAHRHRPGAAGAGGGSGAQARRPGRGSGSRHGMAAPPPAGSARRTVGAALFRGGGLLRPGGVHDRAGPFRRRPADLAAGIGHLAGHVPDRRRQCGDADGVWPAGLDQVDEAAGTGGHDADPVGQHGRLVERMGDQQHGGAGLAPEAQRHISSMAARSKPPLLQYCSGMRSAMAC